MDEISLGMGVECIFSSMGRCGELLLYQRIFLPGKDKVFVVSLANHDSRWVLSLRVFSKICCRWFLKTVSVTEQLIHNMMLCLKF